MQISYDEGNVVLTRSEGFLNLAQTLECGQCFSFLKKLAEQEYAVCAFS